MVYKSKALQNIYGSSSRTEVNNASDIAKLKREVERLTLKVEQLTGERGDNSAVRSKEPRVVIINSIDLDQMAKLDAVLRAYTAPSSTFDNPFWGMGFW